VGERRDLVLRQRRQGEAGDGGEGEKRRTNETHDGPQAALERLRRGRASTSERQPARSSVPSCRCPKNWMMSLLSAPNASSEVTCPSLVGFRTAHTWVM